MVPFIYMVKKELEIGKVGREIWLVNINHVELEAGKYPDADTSCRVDKLAWTSEEKAEIEV